MISSCKECKTKCCRSGLPPYRSVSYEDWLSHKQVGSERYGTKCENFDEEKEICKVWNNPPFICEVYVCGVRTYTKEELERIDYLWKKYNEGNNKKPRTNDEGG